MFIHPVRMKPFICMPRKILHEKPKAQIKKEIMYIDIKILYSDKKMKVGDISVDAGWLQRDLREDFTDMNTSHKYNY